MVFVVLRCKLIDVIMKKTNALLSILIVIITSGFLIYGTSIDKKEIILHEGTALYFPIEVDFAGE